MLIQITYLSPVNRSKCLDIVPKVTIVDVDTTELAQLYTAQERVEELGGKMQLFTIAPGTLLSALEFVGLSKEDLDQPGYPPPPEFPGFVVEGTHG